MRPPHDLLRLMWFACSSLAVAMGDWPLKGITREKLEAQQCQSPVYCQGPILEAIQNSGVFSDSKKYVDLVGRYSEDTILKNYRKLPKNPSRNDLMKFLIENFRKQTLLELKPVIPTDWKAAPKFLDEIIDIKLRQFSADIHSKWKSLSRMVRKERKCSTCASSLIDLPFPFVVPGGRFIELYYWDSFWVLEGLFVSEMCESAHFMIKNLLWMIEQFGYVPNGSRIYYLNRSQPPLLTQMIDKYLDACVEPSKKAEFVKEVLPYLDQEYQFWDNFRSIQIPNPKDSKSSPLKLNIYDAQTTLPRPEAFLQDSLLAKAYNVTGDDRSALFRNIAAGAESGWDFSSRWFRTNSLDESQDDSSNNMSQIRTTEIIPVELNSILYKNERILESFHNITGDSSLSKNYSRRANDRLDAIRTLLWNSTENRWLDFDIKNNRQFSGKIFFVTDLSPLFFGAYDEGMNLDVEGILKGQERAIKGYPGGIPTDEVRSGQQWDFPNVWAPIQYYFIELYLRQSQKHPEKKKYWRKEAIGVAQKMVNAVYCGYSKHGQVFEKYNAEMVGEPGGGGEYIVQEGFGWTNGVILWIMKNFAAELRAPTNCPLIAHPARRRQTSISLIEFAFQRKQNEERFMKMILEKPLISCIGIALLLVIVIYFIRRLKKDLEYQNNYNNADSRSVPIADDTLIFYGNVI